MIEMMSFGHVIGSLFSIMNPDDKVVETCKQCDWSGVRVDCVRPDPLVRRWHCPVCRHQVRHIPSTP